MEIPDRLEDLTASWLSEAVQQTAPGASALSVDVLDAHSGTTGRARLRVEWSSSDLPQTLFVKLAPTDPIQRAMVIETGMGAREARFYREVSASVPVRVARHLCSFWAPDGKAYIMLMEDLAAAGCTFPTHESATDIAVVRSTVEQLARLHGGFWNSPRFASDLAWIEPPMRSEFGVVMVKQGVEAFGQGQPACFREAARLYCGHHQALSNLLDHGTPTLLHGDAHIGNMFVEDGTIGLLDWACVSRGPGLRDVGYYLANSVDTDVRRAEQEELIARYVKTLRESGGPTLTMDEAWRGYRLYAIASWVAAVVTLAAGDRMQATAVGARAVQRTNAAIADLETTTLIEEELGL